MLKKVDHIGFAVYSIDQARVFYEKALGLTCDRIEKIESQQVRTAFFSLGETRIELLEPTDPASPLARFLTKNGEGMHHIGYLSDNLEAQLEQAEKNGCTIINPEPVVGAGGKRISFLHPGSAHGVLTEICEKKRMRE
ncbi:MAG: methylmalonyl-CoA epimerase [Desulfobulbaceae bacterium]|nr:methylmalonyl-CoA epimerase [Desulfobulbaceae bacterium]